MIGMTNSERQQWGMEVRLAREGKRWTQAELAKQSGISLRIIGAIERGEQDTSAPHLYKLQKALGMEATPERTWQSWDRDVQAFCLAIGAWLSTLSPDERIIRMGRIGGQIMGGGG
jgi:transcriptional regulator with XRE-family HTH domain